MSLFFRDIAPFCLTFSKIGHGGYMLGPKILFSSMLVLYALITTCFEKKYFGHPRAIYHIFGDVVFLYPSEAPRSRHGQVPKNRRIFFARPAIIFIYPSGINLRFPNFLSFFKNKKCDDTTTDRRQTNTYTTYDTQCDNNVPWRRNTPRM